MVPSLKTGSPTRNKKRLPFLGQALRLAVPPRLAAYGSYLVVTVNGVGRFPYFRVPIPGSGLRSQVVFAGFGFSWTLTLASRSLSARRRLHVLVIAFDNKSL